MVKGTCGTKKSGWVLKKEWVVDEEMRGKWKFFFNAEGNLQTREKRGRQLKVCEKKEGGSESVTEK